MLRKTEMSSHKERAHARLSPSGASRWTVCTPSAILDEMYPEQSSPYAEEGTLAHEYAEAALRIGRSGRGAHSAEAAVESVRHRFVDHPSYSAEMPAEVEKFVGYVATEFANEFFAGEAFGWDVDLLLEERVSLEPYFPDGFGTNDVAIVSTDRQGVPRRIHIIDLKYGLGDLVYAQDNPQLKIYAIGQLLAHPKWAEATEVEVTCSIVQPRRDHISTANYTSGELLNWADDLLVQITDASNGEGELVPGVEVCKYCKHLPYCKAYENKIQKVKKVINTDIHTLSEEELLANYEDAKLVANWLKKVEAYLFQQAVEGKEWKGYKLVEGRGRRVITDEGKAAELLLGDGYLPEEIQTVKLNSMTQLEKTVGKKRFAELLGEVLDKKPGSLQLAPESDNRPAANLGAAADFDEEFNND